MVDSRAKAQKAAKGRPVGCPPKKQPSGARSAPAPELRASDAGHSLQGGQPVQTKPRPKPRPVVRFATPEEGSTASKNSFGTSDEFAAEMLLTLSSRRNRPATQPKHCGMDHDDDMDGSWARLNDGHLAADPGEDEYSGSEPNDVEDIDSEKDYGEQA